MLHAPLKTSQSRTKGGRTCGCLPKACGFAQISWDAAFRAVLNFRLRSLMVIQLHPRALSCDPINPSAAVAVSSKRAYIMSHAECVASFIAFAACTTKQLLESQSPLSLACGPLPDSQVAGRHWNRTCSYQCATVRLGQRCELSLLPYAHAADAAVTFPSLLTSLSTGPG